MNKKCLVCCIFFSKKTNESYKQFNQKKVCSKKCNGELSRKRMAGKKLPPETIAKMRGKTPHNKGVFVSNTYGSVHTWLIRNFPKTNCQKCGSSRFVEFALRKGKKHKHIRNNYLLLCSSCHKKYDYTKERKKKLSLSLKGRQILWKSKIADAMRGKILSNEQKEKISAYKRNNPTPRCPQTGKFISI